MLEVDMVACCVARSSVQVEVMDAGSRVDVWKVKVSWPGHAVLYTGAAGHVHYVLDLPGAE